MDLVTFTGVGGQMDNIEVAFFDLFFTLVKPAYAENEEDNEYYDLGLSREEWEEIA